MHKTEEKVLKFIEENQLFRKGQLVIVGVSGGADSIALLSILHNNGYRCLAAHCNFHLRGSEADRDMGFVECFCEEHNIDYAVSHFNTADYAKRTRQSIEMAARELRYNWFEQLKTERGSAILAIAHHSDDVIETFFINMLRGAGLHGLTGIKENNGCAVRPMLCVSRAEILDYLEFKGQEYVTDSSNLRNDYLRNKIRNIVIPELENASPEAKKSILKTVQHLRASEELQNNTIEHWRNNVSECSDSIVKIDLLPIVENDHKRILLFELLRPFGGTEQIADSILKSKLSASGLEFYTSSHRIVKDRQRLLISNMYTTTYNKDVYTIDSLDTALVSPFRLSMETYKNGEKEIIRTAQHCYLDKAKVVLPLILRHWKNGDIFVPFGRSNKKKLSDFFINEKMSLPEKESCYILENGNGEILWIVGKRSDNRYRITENTKDVLHLSI